MYTQSCCEVFQYHSEVDAGQCPQQFSFENFLPQISSRTRLILWPRLLLRMLVTYWASHMAYSNLKRETWCKLLYGWRKGGHLEGGPKKVLSWRKRHFVPRKGKVWEAHVVCACVFSCPSLKHGALSQWTWHANTTVHHGSFKATQQTLMLFSPGFIQKC